MIKLIYLFYTKNGNITLKIVSAKFDKNIGKKDHDTNNSLL